MIPIDWKNPRAREAGIVIAGVLLAALAVGLWLQLGPRRGNGTSVVLITLDAARADRLGSYGGGVRTPHLDALARDGVRFEQAYTPAPLCLPAHASILTGRWPRSHGVRTAAQDLAPGGGATAAELFKRAGYRTAAVVSSTLMDRSRGLARGFDEYLDDLNSRASAPGAASARTPRRWWTARWAGWPPLDPSPSSCGSISPMPRHPHQPAGRPGGRIRRPSLRGRDRGARPRGGPAARQGRGVAPAEHRRPDLGPWRRAGRSRRGRLRLLPLQRHHARAAPDRPAARPAARRRGQGPRDARSTCCRPCWTSADCACPASTAARCSR